MLGGYSQDIHWGQEESNHQRYRQSHPVESMMRDYWLIHHIVRMNHHNLDLRLMVTVTVLVALQKMGRLFILTVN